MDPRSLKLLTRERFPETLHVKIVLVRHILREKYVNFREAMANRITS
jgi:hypothetical protein